jgi:hypothetical protein
MHYHCICRGQQVWTKLRCKTKVKRIIALQEDLLINSFTSLNELPLPNMFDEFRKMRDDGKLLAFRGVLTSETITALLRFAEVRLAAIDLPLKK